MPRASCGCRPSTHPRHASFSGPRRLLGLSTFSPSLRPGAWLWTQPSLAGSVTSVSASQFCPWPLWTWSFPPPRTFSKASFQVEISQSSLGLPACEPSSHRPLHLRWATGRPAGVGRLRSAPGLSVWGELALVPAGELEQGQKGAWPRRGSWESPLAKPGRHIRVGTEGKDSQEGGELGFGFISKS